MKVSDLHLNSLNKIWFNRYWPEYFMDCPKRAELFILPLHQFKERMSDEDRAEFLKAAEAYKKKIMSSKKAARQSLIDIGIITEKGNFRKPYRNLGKLFKKT